MLGVYVGTAASAVQTSAAKPDGIHGDRFELADYAALCGRELIRIRARL